MGQRTAGNHAGPQRHPMNQSPEQLRQAALPIIAMAAMAPGLAAAMIEAFTLVPLSADDKRYLHSPILVHEAGGWGAAHIPDWMPPQIRAERVEIILGLQPRWLVGPTEIVAVMHAATLAAPLQREPSDLYVWATVQAMARKLGKPPEHVWETIRPVGSNEPAIPDEEVLAPRGRLYMTYLGLSQEIRRKTGKVQMERDRATRNGSPVTPS
jgi:hypothetical protein